MNSKSRRRFVALRAELMKRDKSQRQLQARADRIHGALDRAEKELKEVRIELKDLEQELLQGDLFDPPKLLVDQVDEAPEYGDGRLE